MKHKQIAVSGMAALLGLGLVACKPQPKLDTEDAKAAYALGYMTGKTSETQVPDLDTQNFVAGFQDAYAKKEGAMKEEDMKAALMAFQKRVMEKAQARAEQAQVEEERKGTSFLAENAKKAGVKSTASGLQYQVVTEGKGAKPVASDTVKVHYEGKLLDGTVFDSSKQRGEPATFRLDQVIPGWTEGVQLMPVGSTYKFVIPSKLAYGPGGTGPIPPNATLMFEVELLEIVK